MKSRRPRHGATRGDMRGGTLIGLAFGLVVGVLISFGVVWYLNKTPLPFVEKVLRPDSKEKSTDGPVALPGKPGDKPIVHEKKFEFYDILEGKKPAAPGVPQTPAPAARPETPAAPPAATSQVAETAPVAVPAAAPASMLYLQVGAFQKAADAESLKGRLAMLGFEAGVQAADVPDKGLMHRVRVGPYADTEQMNRSRGQLSHHGIPATVVRIKE